MPARRVSGQPAQDELEILARHPAYLVQGFAHRGDAGLAFGIVLGERLHQADAPHTLLRAGRKRKCTASRKHRDEGAPPHSITSSALAMREVGIVRPSALAVFRLKMSSYLVGACIGREGFGTLDAETLNVVIDALERLHPRPSVRACQLARQPHGPHSAEPPKEALMEPVIVLAPLLGAILIGAISPGPSFILVARTAIAVSRLDGLAAALGMGLGASFFAGAALLGLHAVLAGVPSVYLAVKLVGGAYLLYLAFRLWRGAGEPIAVPEASGGVPASVLKSFFLGLATQLSNPKTAVVYASIFAALLPTGQTWSSGLVLVSLIFAVETAWYALVAVAFSAERPRQGYLRSKLWIDRMAGAVMGLLGLKLMSDLR